MLFIVNSKVKRVKFALRAVKLTSSVKFSQVKVKLPSAVKLLAKLLRNFYARSECYFSTAVIPSGRERDRRREHRSRNLLYRTSYHLVFCKRSIKPSLVREGGFHGVEDG